MGGDSQPAGGTEKFILLTDIARSSWLTEAYPQQYYAALEKHNSIIEHTVDAHDGQVLKSLGDGYLALFNRAAQAVEAAVELQLAFNTREQGDIAAFPDGSKLGVRAVVHGGSLTRLAGQIEDWYGPALNRSARIGKVCHPGQLLISGVVREALPALSPELAELDLGQVRLRDLGAPEQLYQLTHPGFAQRQFPPLMDLSNRPNNLMAQPHAFIGRDREIAELSHLLAGDTRLLTLHGHGGYGKSRLASQLCAHLLWRFDDGAFEVLLAPLTDYRQLPEAVAGALGFPFHGNREPREQLLNYLRSKELLLCLDSLEHLLDGADLVAEILSAAPKVRILATSREPLRLTAEHVYPVGPLPLGPGSDSVLLYTDRAARVRHGFTLDAETAPWVERICERLEGIPLAIELNAAWADQFLLEQMYAELERQLEVTARMRDVPARQRSVRASCDWSYGLLKPELQEALRYLAVSQGGFFADAAEAILRKPGFELHQILAALCDKSWLFTRQVTWELPGATVSELRYFLRDTASQEYALQCLSAMDNTEEYTHATERHAGYYAELLARKGPRLKGADTPDGGHAQAEAVKRIEVEWDNISVALTIALARREPAWLQPIARHLWRILDITGDFRTMQEQYGRLAQVAQELNGAELAIDAQLGLARAYYSLGDRSAARSAASTADKLAAELGDNARLAQAKIHLATVENRQGNFAAARASIEEALALWIELADTHGEASARYNLGKVELAQGNLSPATSLIEQALALYREIGDRYGEANSLFNLGLVGLMQGDCESSRALFEQARQLQHELGDVWGEAQSISNLGNVEGTVGNLARAREHFTQALVLQRELGDRPGEAYAIVNLAAVERALGNDGAAQAVYHQALKIARAIGDATLEAYCLHELACILLKGRDFGAAREPLAAALSIRLKLGDQYRICESLAAAGSLLAGAGQLASAALSLHGASQAAAQLGSQFNPAESELLEHGLAAVNHPHTGLAAEELTDLVTRAQALSPDELVQFTLDSLAELNAATGPDAVQAGS